MHITWDKPQSRKAADRSGLGGEEPPCYPVIDDISRCTPPYCRLQINGTAPRRRWVAGYTSSSAEDIIIPGSPPIVHVPARRSPMNAEWFRPPRLPWMALDRRALSRPRPLFAGVFQNPHRWLLNGHPHNWTVLVLGPMSWVRRCGLAPTLC